MTRLRRNSSHRPQAASNDKNGKEGLGPDKGNDLAATSAGRLYPEVKEVLTRIRETLTPAVRPLYTFHARGRSLVLGRRTAVMGVINVTPDSFFRDSRRLDPDKAVARSLEMARAGADIIDVGGESTRPGAAPVTAEEELHRVEPVISELRRRTHILISIDTRKAAVAEKAIELGADIVNDVSGLVSDSRIAEIVAQAGAGLVLMHMKGTPEHMQEAPVYQDVVGEVKTFLDGAIQQAEAAGVAPGSILVDPGIGFGKTAVHNLQLLNRLGLFASSGKPILIGTSRKSFIGRVLDLPPEDRLYGTAATVVASILRGAHVVRVHDVPEMIQVARMTDAVANETPEASSRSSRCKVSQ